MEPFVVLGGPPHQPEVSRRVYRSQSLAIKTTAKPTAQCDGKFRASAITVLQSSDFEQRIKPIDQLAHSFIRGSYTTHSIIPKGPR